MTAADADGFAGWLLAAIGGAMDARRVGPDAAGSVQAELAKFAGAAGVRVRRACRNGGRVDAMLADETGSRWAVVAGLDGQDRVVSLWVQREPAAFTGTAGGVVVVLNGPSSSGKSTLATAIQQAADTPWIRLLPDEFFQWHLPERYGAFGRAAGPWQEGFLAMLAALARASESLRPRNQRPPVMINASIPGIAAINRTLPSPDPTAASTSGSGPASGRSRAAPVRSGTL